MVVDERLQALLEQGEEAGCLNLSAVSSGEETYVFDAKNCQVRPFLRAAIRTQFEPYMRQGLEAVRARIEGSDS